MVAGQPELIQILGRFVFKDFLRAQMAVPVEDRLGFCRLVEQRFCRFGRQKKIIVQKGLHVRHLLSSVGFIVTDSFAKVNGKPLDFPTKSG